MSNVNDTYTFSDTDTQDSIARCASNICADISKTNDDSVVDTPSEDDSEADSDSELDSVSAADLYIDMATNPDVVEVSPPTSNIPNPFHIHFEDTTPEFTPLKRTKRLTKQMAMPIVSDVTEVEALRNDMNKFNDRLDGISKYYDMMEARLDSIEAKIDRVIVLLEEKIEK